jgi:hypothetical protein
MGLLLLGEAPFYLGWKTGCCDASPIHSVTGSTDLCDTGDLPFQPASPMTRHFGSKAR